MFCYSSLRLAQSKPDEVVRRFESGIFQHDEKCAAIYIDVMSKLNRVDRMDKASLLAAYQSSPNTFKGNGTQNIFSNSSHGPFLVTIRPPTASQTFWRWVQ